MVSCFADHFKIMHSFIFGNSGVASVGHHALHMWVHIFLLRGSCDANGTAAFC